MLKKFYISHYEGFACDFTAQHCSKITGSLTLNFLFRPITWINVYQQHNE